MAFIAATRRDHKIGPVHEGEDAEQLGERSSRPSAYQSVSDEFIEDWTVDQVCNWLNEKGVISKVASEAKSLGVDGLVLLSLSSDAWKELGVESAVDRAKIESKVKRLFMSSEGGRMLKPGEVSEQDLYASEAEKALTEMRSHFTSAPQGHPFKVARTKERGAEHRADWALAIASANSNPQEVKQHILRFLGMYNVIDLLVLTINFTYVSAASISGIGTESWADCVILCFMVLSIIMAGVGMVGSTILYNASSAVSDANFVAFTKLPSTLYFIRWVNDNSIWSGIFTTFSIFPFIYKIAVDNGEQPWSERYQYAIPPVLLAFFTFLYVFNGFLSGIEQVTHSAMMGGLFSDVPIPPLRDDETWAHRSSPTEISEYVAKYAMEVGKSVEPKQCGIDCANSYSKSTIEAMVQSAENAKRMSRSAALHLAFSEGDGSSAVMRKKSIFKSPLSANAL